MCHRLLPAIGKLLNEPCGENLPFQNVFGFGPFGWLAQRVEFQLLFQQVVAVELLNSFLIVRRRVGRLSDVDFAHLDSPIRFRLIRAKTDDKQAIGQILIVGPWRPNDLVAAILANSENVQRTSGASVMLIR